MKKIPLSAHPLKHSYFSLVQLEKYASQELHKNVLCAQPYFYSTCSSNVSWEMQLCLSWSAENEGGSKKATYQIIKHRWTGRPTVQRFQNAHNVIFPYAFTREDGMKAAIIYLKSFFVTLLFHGSKQHNLKY